MVIYKYIFVHIDKIKHIILYIINKNNNLGYGDIQAAWVVLRAQKVQTGIMLHLINFSIQAPLLHTQIRGVRSKRSS